MSKTVLIIDDSASFRQVVGRALADEGYDVVAASDGCDALTKLDGRKINLILSDVNMPNMDGISFVKALRLLPDYKFTPVVMLTTESAESKKNEGTNVGARAWVIKPFAPPALLDIVAKFIAA